MTDSKHVQLDSRSLRVLAHPLRSRLLGRLRMDGPATATQLAARLGTTSGTTSYHLRKLAEVGLVAEDEGSGDQRDRWWRSVHHMTSWDQAEFQDDPDDRAAADWLVGYQVRANMRETQNWLDVASEWPVAWIEAADISDLMLNLTPSQAKDLTAELFETLERYRRAGADASIPEPGSGPPDDPEAPVRVRVFLHLHPDAGGLG